MTAVDVNRQVSVLGSLLRSCVGHVRPRRDGSALVIWHEVFVYLRFGIVAGF